MKKIISVVSASAIFASMIVPVSFAAEKNMITVDFTAMTEAKAYTAEAGQGFIEYSSAIMPAEYARQVAPISQISVSSNGAEVTESGAEYTHTKTNSSDGDDFNYGGLIYRVDTGAPGAYHLEVEVTGTSSDTRVAPNGMDSGRLTGTSNWDNCNQVPRTVSAKWSGSTWSYDFGTGEDYIEIEIEPASLATAASPKTVGIKKLTITPLDVNAAGVKPTIHILGDSTEKAYSFNETISSWGQTLKNYFDLSKVNVVNYSMGGRAMKSNYCEGRFDEILISGKAGDFVFIHSAHNDETISTNRFSRGAGSVSGDLAANNENYNKWLDMYVNAIKARGMTPVLVTAMPRINSASGRYSESDVKPNGFNPDSPGSMRAKAASDSEVGFAELYEGAKAYIDKLDGKEVSYIYNSIEAGETPANNAANGANGDGTHYREAAAKQFCRIILQSIYDQANAAVDTYTDKPIMKELVSYMPSAVTAAAASGDWSEVFPEVTNDVSAVDVVPGAEAQSADNFYYRTSIEKALQLGLLHKDTDNLFKPTQTITVGEYARGVEKAFGLEENALTNYTKTYAELMGIEPTEEPTAEPTEKPTEAPTLVPVEISEPQKTQYAEPGSNQAAAFIAEVTPNDYTVNALRWTAKAGTHKDSKQKAVNISGKSPVAFGLIVEIQKKTAKEGITAKDVTAELEAVEKTPTEQTVVASSVKRMKAVRRAAALSAAEAGTGDITVTVAQTEGGTVTAYNDTQHGELTADITSDIAADAVISDNDFFTLTAPSEVTSKVNNSGVFNDNAEISTTYVEIRNNGTKQIKYAAKADGIVRMYLRFDNTKQIICENKTDNSTAAKYINDASAAAEVRNTSAFGYVTFDVTAGKSYELYTQGGTGQLYGIKYEAAEYPNSTSVIHANAGDTIRVVAEADDDHSVNAILVNGEQAEFGGIYSFTVNADTTVSAEFEKKAVGGTTITVVQPEGGVVTVYNDSAYNTQTVDITEGLTSGQALSDNKYFTLTAPTKIQNNKNDKGGVFAENSDISTTYIEFRNADGLTLTYKAKADGILAVYARFQGSKAIELVGSTTQQKYVDSDTSVAGSTEWAYGVVHFDVAAGQTYTLQAKGGTGRLFGIQYASTDYPQSTESLQVSDGDTIRVTAIATGSYVNDSILVNGEKISSGKEATFTAKGNATVTAAFVAEPELVDPAMVPTDAALTREIMGAVLYDAYQLADKTNIDKYMGQNGGVPSPDDPNYDPNIKYEGSPYIPITGWGALTDKSELSDDLYAKVKAAYNLGLIRPETGIARGSIALGTELEPTAQVTRAKAAKSLVFAFILTQPQSDESQMIPEGFEMAEAAAIEAPNPDAPSKVITE